MAWKGFAAKVGTVATLFLRCWHICAIIEGYSVTLVCLPVIHFHLAAVQQHQTIVVSCTRGLVCTIMPPWLWRSTCDSIVTHSFLRPAGAVCVIPCFSFFIDQVFRLKELLEGQLFSVLQGMCSSSSTCMAASPATSNVGVALSLVQ